MAGSSMRIQKAMTSANPKAIRPLASVVEKATMPLALPWAMEEAQDAADFCTSLMTVFHRFVLEHRGVVAYRSLPQAMTAST